MPGLAPPAALPAGSPTLESGRDSYPGLKDAEAATLHSLRQIDPYPLYAMEYFADYDTAAGSVSDQPVNWARSGGDWACSLFAALADPGNMLYGRNFDWDYSPGLLLFTNPPDGYASVSMVNLSYLGYRSGNMGNLADQPLEDIEALLAAPHWPFDGLNQMGLAVGMAAVPGGNMKPDPRKVTLGSLGIIRELLDHAADVEGAIHLFEKYNIDFRGGPPVHYLISDRGGNAALVEYYHDELYVIPNHNPWHKATNFLLTTVDDDFEGQYNRYDTLRQILTSKQGSLDPKDAMNLLENKDLNKCLLLKNRQN